MATFTLNEKQGLLHEVLSIRNADLLPLLEHLNQISDEQRERLREVIADELMETGLDHDDEPNQRGLLLEDIIDTLGHP